MGGRGQAFSIDLIIGVLVFMLAVGIIYSLLIGRSRDDVAPLRIESEVIATKLAEDPAFAVAPNGQLNSEQLKELLAMDYEELKERLGVKNEFCIFLRDESGNLIYILNGTDAYAGVGSRTGDFNLSGTPCGCKVDDTPEDCSD